MTTFSSIFLLGKLHEQRNLVGYSPWGRKELDTTEWLHSLAKSRGNSYIVNCSLEALGWVQFSSVAQSCPTLCDPMNCSTPGLPVHHQLPEFTQTHVHWVSDAIQPSHPLSSPSLAAGVQPRWIQGIRRVDGVGVRKTYLLIDIRLH